MIAEHVIHVMDKAQGSLLDIGAGDGAITKLLEPHFAHITAIEPALPMFNILKKSCSSNKYSLINATFENQNLSDSYNIILASHSFRFLANPVLALEQINNLLQESGLFLIVDLLKESDFWKFYHTYEEDVLGYVSKDPEMLDYDRLLEPIFNFKKIYFTPTVVIPTVDDTVNLLDFFFNIDFNEIKKDALIKIRQQLFNEYGNGPVTIKFQQIMYVCSKKVHNG